MSGAGGARDAGADGADGAGAADGPVLFEVEPEDGAAAMRAFVAWAGGPEGVRILYTPDTLLAVDGPDRRGYLLDEVYFVTLWVGRGADELRERLRHELELPPGGGTGRWTEPPPAEEADPERFLARAVAYGRPLLPEVTEGPPPPGPG